MNLTFESFKQQWKQSDMRFLHVIQGEKEDPRLYFDEISAILLSVLCGPTAPIAGCVNCQFCLLQAAFMCLSGLSFNLFCL